MKALILDAERRTASVQDITKPVPKADEVLVQVHAVALNPVDALYVFNPLGSTGRVVGSDFSGTIASIGEKVPSDCGLRLGTRVAGFCQGACSENDRPGAFAEYLVCPWDLLLTIPEEMEFEQAATLSLCGLTAAQAIYHRLGLEAPFKWQTESSQSHRNNAAPTNVFIYSASTSVAMYAAQLVHHSGEATAGTVKLLGTASERRFPMLKDQPYRYDHLIDYRDPAWLEKILSFTDNRGVQYAFDCISEGDSVLKVSQALEVDGKMAIVRSREGGAWSGNGLRIEPSYGAVWAGLGEDVQYAGFRVPKSPEARAFAVGFFQWLSSGGNLQPNPVRSMPGGLESIVEDGFALLGPDSMADRKSNRGQDKPWMRPISGEKLVYKII
jgi:NADPH:quinone reductase-like Zn-dependent oxidoreductase